MRGWRKNFASREPPVPTRARNDAWLCVQPEKLHDMRIAAPTDFSSHREIRGATFRGAFETNRKNAAARRSRVEMRLPSPSAANSGVLRPHVHGAAVRNILAGSSRIVG